MSRTVQGPDSIATLRNDLRLAEQAASDVVLTVESFRAALRQVVATVHNLPPERLPPPAPAPVALRFLRFKEVGLMCGLSRTTIWRMRREGKFPEGRRISANAVGWLAEEVEQWIQTRAVGG